MRSVIAGMIPSLALLAAGPAFAAGGAHVIDDTAVETPGTCHLENWVTHSTGGQWLVNSAPACTSEALPNLEIGGFVSHSSSPSADETLIGLAPKLTLRSEERGIGIGLSVSAGYGVGRDRFETASLIVPVTIPAGKRLRFNLNSGWQWSHAGHDLFVGGQVECELRPNLSLMGEGFAHARGKAGGQTGLRWTMAGGRMDVDLLAGRYLDGATPTAITLGITLRR